MNVTLKLYCFCYVVSLGAVWDMSSVGPFGMRQVHRPTKLHLPKMFVILFKSMKRNKGRIKLECLTASSVFVGLCLPQSQLQPPLPRLLSFYWIFILPQLPPTTPPLMSTDIHFLCTGWFLTSRILLHSDESENMMNMKLCINLFFLILTGNVHFTCFQREISD